MAFLTVTTGAAGLLMVTFERIAHGVVDDEAHVRLVNAHTEGNGRHNHINFLHQEFVLILRPGLGVQTCVVRKGLDAVDIEFLGEFLNLLAAKAVDYAGFSRILADIFDDVLLRIDLVANLIEEIGAVEGRLEDGGVLDAEVLHNVALDLRGRSRREGDRMRRYSGRKSCPHSEMQCASSTA